MCQYNRRLCLRCLVALLVYTNIMGTFPMSHCCPLVFFILFYSISSWGIVEERIFNAESVKQGKKKCIRFCRSDSDDQYRSRVWGLNDSWCWNSAPFWNQHRTHRVSVCSYQYVRCWTFFQKKGQRDSSTLADKTDFESLGLNKGQFHLQIKVLWCPLVRVWMKCSARRNALWTASFRCFQRRFAAGKTWIPIPCSILLHV